MNMKRLSVSGKRIVTVLTIVFFASVILGMTEKYIPHLDSLAATMYCVFLILWGFTIRIRITDALTNPLHQQIIRMLDPATETSRRGWMYLVLVTRCLM